MANQHPLSAADVNALLRSAQYRRLLVVAGLVGVVVSVACWGFLQLTHVIQQGVYVHLWSGLGFSSAPWWWPLPPLALAGVVIAFAVTRLPGHGGHEPSEGLQPGSPTTAVQVPGAMLAAVATVGLGLVLGPEAPLMALGSGAALFLAGLPKRPVPDQGKQVIAAAGSFAALATIFGSPVIGAVIIIEAAGLGGAMMPVILLPGLVAAGIGSLVFIGVDSVTGLSTNAFALPPLSLPKYPTPRVADFLWTLPLAMVVAVVIFLVFEAAKRTRAVVAPRPWVMFPVAALLVGAVAIAYAEITGQTSDAVLFSGQDAMNSVVAKASTLSLGTLALLLVFKAIAWALSLGAARGGPTFPAIFLGLVGGILASHLPGFAETPAVAVLVAASLVSVLRLPLSSIVLALLVAQGGAGVAPLVIVGVAVAYLTSLTLSARFPARMSSAQPGQPASK